MYSIVSVNFKRIKVLIRLNDDKVLRYQRTVISCCLLQKERKKKEKNTMFTLNILTPYHTMPQKFNNVIHLPVYISKTARWKTFSNDSNHSVFCSRSTLFAQSSGKYSKWQLAGIFYNDVWTADAIRLFSHFFFIFFCNWVWKKKKQLKINNV